MGVSKNFKEMKVKIYKAMIMLDAAHRQKRTTLGLLKIDGGIALAEMFLEEAREYLKKEMDENSLSSNQK